MCQSNTDSKYISLDIPVPPTQATDDICRHYQRRVSHSAGSKRNGNHPFVRRLFPEFSDRDQTSVQARRASKCITKLLKMHLLAPRACIFGVFFTDRSHPWPPRTTTEIKNARQHEPASDCCLQELSESQLLF